MSNAEDHQTTGNGQENYFVTAMIQTFNHLGGVEWFLKWGREYPNEFKKLFGDVVNERTEKEVRERVRQMYERYEGRY